MIRTATADFPNLTCFNGASIHKGDTLELANGDDMQAEPGDVIATILDDDHETEALRIFGPGNTQADVVGVVVAITKRRA